MRIIYSIFILVVLQTSSLIANSSVSRAIVLLARALEDYIWWSSLQKYIAEIIYIFLEGIAFVLVTIARVEGEEATSWQK